MVQAFTSAKRVRRAGVCAPVSRGTFSPSAAETGGLQAAGGRTVAATGYRPVPG
jgi:hypothetical protein